MDDLIRKCREICDELLRNFPEIEGRRIKIFRPPVGFYAFCLLGNFIGVTEACVGLNDSELKGTLAHELGHVVQFRRWGFAKSFIFFLVYFFSKSFKMKTEKEADMIAIESGYAKELAASTKKIIPEIRGVYYGLSSEEIKSYSREIGK